MGLCTGIPEMSDMVTSGETEPQTTNHKRITHYLCGLTQHNDHTQGRIQKHRHCHTDLRGDKLIGILFSQRFYDVAL